MQIGYFVTLQASSGADGPGYAAEQPRAVPESPAASTGTPAATESTKLEPATVMCAFLFSLSPHSLLAKADLRQHVRMRITAKFFHTLRASESASDIAVKTRLIAFGECLDPWTIFVVWIKCETRYLELQVVGLPPVSCRAEMVRSGAIRYYGTAAAVLFFCCFVGEFDVAKCTSAHILYVSYRVGE